MTNKEKIEFIRNHFDTHPDACYITWRGTYPVDDCLYRLNMVFVYVLFKYKDKVLARKIAGTLCHKGNSKKVIFSTELLRAVNNRTKRKRVVTLGDLHINEDSYPAGLLKNVEDGKLNYQINTDRKGDKVLLDVLFEMVNEEDKCLTDNIVKPITYLCAFEKEAYKPKASASLVHTLQMSDKYDEGKSLDYNFNNCFEDCFTQQGEGRWLVMYSWVIGKGIPYIDLSSLYPVYEYKGKIKELDYEDSEFIFNISNSLEW